jgi:hypothetical protein
MGDTRLEPLVLSEAERRTLENWAKRRKTAQGLALTEIRRRSHDPEDLSLERLT